MSRWSSKDYQQLIKKTLHPFAFTMMDPEPVNSKVAMIIPSVRGM